MLYVHLMLTAPELSVDLTSTLPVKRSCVAEEYRTRRRRILFGSQALHPPHKFAAPRVCITSAFVLNLCGVISGQKDTAPMSRVQSITCPED